MNLKDINIGKIIKGLIVFIIFWNSVYLQYIPVILFRLNVNVISTSTKCLLSLFSSLLISIVFILIYYKDLKKDFRDFRKNTFKYLDEGFKYWLIGLIVMVVSNLFITFTFHTGGANNENALQELIKALPWAMFITASIIGPFNEEIVFRKTLLDVFKSKWVVTLLSFLFFGAAHVIGSATVWTDYLYIIPYGALGGAFALADYKCNNNVMPSICMHMAHNTILLIVSIIGFMK